MARKQRTRFGSVHIPPSRKSREKKESVPDLWEPRASTKVPSNPYFRNHSPEYKHIIDVLGNRIPVVKGTIVELQTSRVGLEAIRKLQEPQPAPELWIGPQHYVLTHALRLLQACTVTASRDNPASPNTRRIINGITPSRLLLETGLLPEQVSEVIQKLERAELLASRGRQGKTPIWLVAMHIKGIGHNGQQYQTHQLIDGWALPEELTESASTPSVPPKPNPDKGEDPVAKTTELRQNRHEVLTKVYMASIRYVPKNPDFQDGFAVFTTPTPLPDLVAEQLEITTPQAARCLEDLVKLGVYKARLVSPGVWHRFIKLGEGPFTEKHVVQVREARRRKQVKGAAKVAPAPASNGAVSMTPEQLGDLLIRMDEQIESLKVELETERVTHAATRAELETARAAAAPSLAIPVNLLKKYS